MALFRRKGPEIVRKSSAGGAVEERKTVLVNGQKVEVRRVEAPAPAKPQKDKKSRQQQARKKGGKPSTTRSSSPPSRRGSRCSSVLTNPRPRL